MSWYGNIHQPSRQMNALLETNPTLANLLTSSDFIKYFQTISNPNLQHYLENSPNIPNEIVTYISVPPTQADSIERKHKLPLATLQLIQAKNQWVHRLLYRTTKENTVCFLAMFDMFRTDKEVLPLLAGYFSRVNTVFCRNYKQALDLMYSSPQYLQLLIAHTYDQAIARALKQYMSIELTHIIFISPEQTALKLTMMRNIMKKIQSERMSSDYKSIRLVGNLIDFVREEILEKYNIIHHGRDMVQIILAEKYINIIIELILENSQNSLPAIRLVFMCLRYYVFCCYQVINGQNQQAFKQRIQKIQGEPFIIKLLSQFKPMVQKAKNQKTLNLYSYNILNVLCHTIKLPMTKIFEAVKQSALIPTLIDLLFQYQSCNIMHKLIEGLFEELFATDNRMYDKYKEYLFCNVSIIDLTAIRLYKLFPETDGYQRARKKGYFGPLIQIIKKYSTIMAHTTNPQIRNQINASTQICQKFSQKIMGPHETICKNNLGEYQDVPKTAPLQYTVINTIGAKLVTRPFQNAEAVEQVKKQQQGMTKLLQAVVETNSYSQRKSFDDSDSFYKNPIEDVLNKNIQQPKNLSNGSSYQPIFMGAPATTPIVTPVKPEYVKGQPFSQAFGKMMMKAEQQNREKKSQSAQKRLSADKKARLASPSNHKKRNSWKQQTQQQKNQQKAPTLSNHLPKVPGGNKIPMTSPNFHSATYSTNGSDNLTKSLVQEKRSFKEENKRMMSLSTANLQSLKKTTIIRTTEQPTEKKFRKIQERDKALFAYLGINC